MLLPETSSFLAAVLLQNIHDCRLDALITSLRKLRKLAVSALSRPPDALAE